MEKRRKHGNFLFLSVNENKIKDVEEKFTMNKKLVASITTALVMGAFGTTFAAPADSFSDVPKDHWAYQAVQELAKDGVIQGYSDSEFKGDRPLTRYEFSMVVAKAIDNFETASENDKATIDKLSAEFAGELNRLGKRVAVVEKKTNTWIEGESRVRYLNDNSNTGKSLKGSDKFDFRHRVSIKGNVDDKISYTGRLVVEDKFGDMSKQADGSKGSEVRLDIANVTVKDSLGFDRIRVGRAPMDTIGHGLIGKPNNVDGILLEKNFGNTKMKLFTGDPEVNANADYADGSLGNAQQITTVDFTQKLNDKMNLGLGYFWSDAMATAKPNGTGDLNIDSITAGATGYTSSKGASVAFDYKLGKYTLMTDYMMTKLDGVAAGSRLSDSPKGWAVQISNSVGPKVYYNAVNLVDKTKAGTDAWMFGYRSIDAGAVPHGVGGFNTIGVAYAGPTNPYNVFTHGTDNVNVWSFVYQNVLRKNVIMTLEYQDFKIKDQSLTGLTSKKLDKTFKAQFEFWY
jgi:hypothetical protein